MFIWNGTRGDDQLSAYWSLEPVTMRLRAGDDFGGGSEYDDLIYGDAGSDALNGYGGNDALLGGRGDDLLEDLSGWNQLWGGVGDDDLYGIGWTVGGKGTDYIQNAGGSSWGDEGPGNVPTVRGNDFLHTDFAENPWLGREFFGGKGSDHFSAYFAPADGVATRLDVRDWSAAEGDKLTLWYPGAAPGLDGTFRLFDTNGDQVIDGRDPWSAMGGTWADPNANAVCFYMTGGDMVAVWGTQSVTAADFGL